MDTLPALRPPPLCPVATWPPGTPTHLSLTGVPLWPHALPVSTPPPALLIYLPSNSLCTASRPGYLFA